MLITWVTPSLQCTMVLAASWSEEFSETQGQGDWTEVREGRMKANTVRNCIHLEIRTTVHLLESLYPQVYSQKDTGVTVGQVSDCLRMVRPETGIMSVERCPFTDDSQPTGQSLRGSTRKKGINCLNPGVQSLWRLWPRRFKSVNAAKEDFFLIQF